MENSQVHVYLYNNKITSVNACNKKYVHKYCENQRRTSDYTQNNLQKHDLKRKVVKKVDNQM